MPVYITVLLFSQSFRPKLLGGSCNQVNYRQIGVVTVNCIESRE